MVYLLVLFIFVAGYIPGVLSASLDQRDFLKLKPSSKTLEGDDCTVVFLKDPKEKSWVLKQVNNKNIEEQVKLVFDYIVSKMAEDAQIPIPRTYLIPQEWKHSAKFYEGRLALLQEMVPGEAVGEHGKINIHQSSRSPMTKVLMDQRFGKLHEKDMGLTLSVIKNISLHEDLSTIAAFDTFINNSDRSGPNLFYDQKTNRYYGIDHLAAFTNKKLAFHANRHLQQGYDFTEEERKGLKNYRLVLEKLYKNFPPSQLISDINTELKKWFPDQLENPALLDMLSGYESFIHAHYEETALLIARLREIEGIS